MVPNEQSAHGDNTNSTSEDVRAFYTSHPYPPPAEDLDEYQATWQDHNRQLADFHLHWPGNPYREDLTVLVAGCGTSQAARYALRYPAAQIVGIDFSSTSIHHTLKLKNKYHLNNLSVHLLPVERVSELGLSFDKIVCTGVLHHLPSPESGLRALVEVLEPDGAIYLMVYAAYGRFGAAMLKEYASLVEVGDTDAEINDFANTLMSLPDNHPMARILSESPDFRTRAGLADALLNPQDRAYSVQEFMELISAADLQFGRWVRQAPYLPQCGRFAGTPHGDRLGKLPLHEQFTAMELLRGTMLRHSAVIYHESNSQNQHKVRFDLDQWGEYIPIRTPGSTLVQENIPPDMEAVLINRNHSYPDLILPIDKSEMWFFDAIDGQRSIDQIIQSRSASDDPVIKSDIVRKFFQHLWWYDHIVFDISSSSNSPSR
jgi:SAM-dependent methyltransferase